MTTRQRKWQEIGVAFETEPEKRTEKQDNLTGLGLCYSYKRDELKAFATKSGYWWPSRTSAWCSRGWTRQCDYERATFAYFMAAMPDSDYEEMVR